MFNKDAKRAENNKNTVNKYNRNFKFNMPEFVINSFGMIKSITFEGASNIKHFISINANYAVDFAEFMFPYVAYYCGTNEIANKYIFFVPVAFSVIVFYIRAMLNRIGRGSKIPVPAKRFTIDNDGEIEVEKERISELIIYVSELEDYFEKKGMI